MFLARSAPYDCRVMLVELFCCACEVHVGRGGSVLLAGSAPYYCSVTPVGWCCACEVHVGGGGSVFLARSAPYHCCCHAGKAVLCL